METHSPTNLKMTKPMNLSITLLLLTLGMLTAACSLASGQEQEKLDEPLAYRSMAFTNPRDATLKMLQRGHEMGFNDICVHTEHGEQAEDIRKVREHFEAEGILDFVAQNDMTISVWVHEFMDYDESWGPRELENKKLWDGLAQRYDHYLTELFPELDYLVLTTVETQHRIAFDDPLLPKVVKVLNDACERHGRTLIYRTFRHWPAFMRDGTWKTNLMDVIPKSVIIQHKTVAQDFHMRGLWHPLIGEGEKLGFDEFVEFDACGEYFRRNNLANVYTDALETRLRDHLSKGIDGISVRMDRRGRNSFDHPNQANGWYLVRAANGGALDNAAQVEAFCAEYFNPQVAPALAKLLRSTATVNAEALCVFDETFGNSRGSSLQRVENPFSWPWSPGKWLSFFDEDDPRVARLAQIESGDPEIIAAEEERYAEALELAGQHLRDLEELKEQLDPESYALLKWLLEENQLHLICMQEWQLAWLKGKRATLVEDASEQERLRKEVRAHLDKAASMAEETGETFETNWHDTHRDFERGEYMDIEAMNRKIAELFLPDSNN